MYCFVVVAGALYNQYKQGREEKAASAYSVAMKGEGGEKHELLTKVVEEYGSTPSGLWSRIELAHIAVEKGELVKAIEQFNDVKNEVSAKNPVMPLVIYALGALYEKNNELDKAVAAFNELSTFKSFEAGSYEAMGRLYEQQGDKAKAVEMYKKAVAINSESVPPQPGNPNRETIQARINYLQD